MWRRRWRHRGGLQCHGHTKKRTRGGNVKVGLLQFHPLLLLLLLRHLLLHWQQQQLLPQQLAAAAAAAAVVARGRWVSSSGLGAREISDPQPATPTDPAHVMTPGSSRGWIAGLARSAHPASPGLARSRSRPARPGRSDSDTPDPAQSVRPPYGPSRPVLPDCVTPGRDGHALLLPGWPGPGSRSVLSHV
jgi:hypothetical protein